jgi:hypothetical protein
MLVPFRNYFIINLKKKEKFKEKKRTQNIHENPFFLGITVRTPMLSY